MAMAHSEGNRKFDSVRALVFDLDGTLIDSKLDLALAVNAMLEHMGRTPLPHPQIYALVGNGAPTLVCRALGDTATDAEVEKALAFFLHYYRDHLLDNTVLYPGVREGLDRLQGFSLAVLTNKPALFSQRILQGLGIAPLFRYVYGGNSFERKKPDPMGLERILRDFDVPPRAAMMVGDSEVDVRTARNAGAWACGVTYGLGSARLAGCPPDLLLDSLADLADYLAGDGWAGAGRKKRN